MKQLSLAAVGAQYPNRRGPGRRFEIEVCAPGEPIDLILEPKNLVDPRAVAVFSCRGVQLGYLTAERCGWIGSMIREGRELRVVFQASTTFGAWVRVAFDGAEPVLPQSTGCSASANNDDFWPDEIYPDD